LTGLTITALVGVAGLAVDVGYWQVEKRSMQGVSDEAAYSAAIAAAAGGNITTQAQAVAAQHGFVNGVGGVTVAVNQPPTQGNFTLDTSAIEVIITAPQKQYLSKLFLASATASTRSVAATKGGVCMLTTDTNGGDKHSFFVKGAGNTVDITGCTLADNLLSDSGTDSLDVKGTATLIADNVYLRDASYCDGGSCAGTYTVGNSTYNQPAITDPYASRAVPSFSGCDHTNMVVATSTTLSPGVYCGTNNNPSLTITSQITETASANANAGTTSISLGSITGVSVGMYLTDQNQKTAIAAGATVTAVGVSSITVSAALVAQVKNNDTIVFSNGPFQTESANANPPAATISMTATTGITTGMSVSDVTTSNAIATGTTVSAVSANSITLSQALANKAKSGDVLQFGSPVTVTLNSGVYFLDGQGGSGCTGSTKPAACVSGNLDIDAGVAVHGTGVSIILTTSTGTAINIGNVGVDDSSTLTLTPSSSGESAGIALWVDSRAPNPGNPGGGYSEGDAGVNTVGSGSSANITGVSICRARACCFPAAAAPRARRSSPLQFNSSTTPVSPTATAAAWASCRSAARRRWSNETAALAHAAAAARRLGTGPVLTHTPGVPRHG
jgi:hypothetical protein